MKQDDVHFLVAGFGWHLEMDNHMCGTFIGFSDLVDCSTFKLESLILAQNERWRQA